jgi:hypothetical protein
MGRRGEIFSCLFFESAVVSPIMGDFAISITFGERQMMAQLIARRLLVSPLINKNFREKSLLSTGRCSNRQPISLIVTLKIIFNVKNDNYKFFLIARKGGCRMPL